jgi:very-short-patch-repair endonuclease
MNKFIKNPSKPEIKLRDIVKELYPTCEFQYQIFNYSLDVAIPEYKIAIEYDGWFHFDCQEHIDYHIDRQQRIEGEGWIFIKYTMYDKFPSKEKIEEDINSLLRRNQCQR